DGVAQADIGIADGTISQIASPGTLRGRSSIDADAMVVLPGAIDMHVHFRDPGLTHKEDFLHGSAAAVCGGVTTVCDMPNTVPPTIDQLSLVAKADAVRTRSYCDFALWIGGAQIDSYAGLAEAGAVGLKVFMSKSAANSPALGVDDDAVLLRVL